VKSGATNQGVSDAPSSARGCDCRASTCTGRRCLELACERACAPAVRLRPGAPVRRRAAPRDRHRRRRRSRCCRARGRHRDVCRHGAGLGQEPHDLDRRRTRGHPDPPGLDLGRRGGSDRRGARRRDDRPDGGSRGAATVRSPRHPDRVGAAGVPRSALVPASAAGRRAAARADPGSRSARSGACRGPGARAGGHRRRTRSCRRRSGAGRRHAAGRGRQRPGAVPDAPLRGHRDPDTLRAAAAAVSACPFAPGTVADDEQDAVLRRPSRACGCPSGRRPTVCRYPCRNCHGSPGSGCSRARRAGR
jgi:hypothetical protein